jgi:hypothetical protein
MKNWVSALWHKVWQRIRHSRQHIVNTKHNSRIKAHLPARDDAKSPAEHGLHFSDSLSLDPRAPSLSNESTFVKSATSQGAKRQSPSSELWGYLRERENREQDIDKLAGILIMPQVLMEVGCGNAETARQIALKNPNIGVIATDLYDWSHPQCCSSGYGKIARQWRAGQLPAQIDPLSNLVILRAETDLLQYCPNHAIDTIILINPEPLVGKAILKLLQGESLSLRIKQGPNQIVVLPYSRELGLMACGGCEFEHAPDWSRGLGFIMESGLRFKRGASIQWGVDLSRISAYTGNSTQRDIYIYGKQPIRPASLPRRTR